jgi:hypothetical protein
MILDVTVTVAVGEERFKVEARASERTLADMMPGAIFTFTRDGIRRTGTIVAYATAVVANKFCPVCAFVVTTKHDKAECERLLKAADDMERADESLALVEANGAR